MQENGNGLDIGGLPMLFRFLKEKGAFANYMHNLKNAEGKSIKTFFQSYKSNTTFILSLSFFWEDTKEGYSYWEGLHHAYIKYIQLFG